MAWVRNIDISVEELREIKSNIKVYKGKNSAGEDGYNQAIKTADLSRAFRK